MTAPLANTAWDDASAVLTRRGVLILRSQQRRQRRVLLAACAIAIAGLVVAFVTVLAVGGGDMRTSARGGAQAVTRMTLPAAVTDSAVIYDTAVMPLAPEEASAINAERPLDVAKVVPAKALRIAAESAKGVGYAAALRCLTQAVYYEAAGERDGGQSAVAQVVLNRLRHPAFPNTICGVVYQGSERVTGCQFSFTCDGSLARTPSVAGWARAERAAREALAGRVASAVGNATHYHANYVVPYWAPTLDKVATIGTHIFYIMRGFLGSPRAFSGRYDVAQEVSPETAIVTPDVLGGDQTGLLDPLDTTATLVPGLPKPAEDGRSGSLIPDAQAAGLDAAAAVLRADETRGELKAGQDSILRVDDAKRPPAPAISAESPDGD